MKYAVSFEGFDFSKGITINEIYVGDDTNRVSDSNKPVFKTLEQLSIIFYIYGITVVDAPAPVEQKVLIFDSPADLVDNVTGSKKFMQVTYDGMVFNITPDGKKPIEVGGEVASVAVTAPGTGFTSVPDIKAATGDAEFSGTLKAISGTVTAGGAGYAVNDIITLANGVKVKVATINAGAVATVTIDDGGELIGDMADNPVAQESTTGAGTNATITLTYGLGTVEITNPGYYSGAAPVIDITGGGGNGATATATLASASSNYVSSILVKSSADSFGDATHLQLVMNGNVLFNGVKDSDIDDMSSLVDWLTGNFDFLGDFEDISSDSIQAISVTGSSNFESANFIRLR